ncbi:MAG: hypothetical protein JNL67_20435 [Planctomycetaceae bacterium]|nr:hypothetical protein [Planctomycetaceae bacterium]
MNHQTCATDCQHTLGEMDVRFEHPAPDYSAIDFLPAPAGLNTIVPARDLGNNYYIAPANADIPYAFSIGAVTFAGMLYIRGSDGRDTYTDGGFAGAVNGVYHLDRHNVHVRGDGVGIRAHILIDFGRKHAVAWIETLGLKCCGYRNWGKCDTWNSSRQVVIASW